MTALPCPNKRSSGTNRNSIVFIAATINICISAHHRDFIPLRIQTAIKISNIPIVVVIKGESSSPSILPTICRWRGTRLSSLQYNPLISQTRAIHIFRNFLTIVKDYTARYKDKFKIASPFHGARCS